MKKNFIMAFFLMFILFGCTGIFNREEKTDEYKLLSEQYNEFLDQDIINYDQFKTFINHTTLNSALASVVLRVEIRDYRGELLDSRIGSGTIFYSDPLYYHVVSTYDLVHIARGQYASFYITDIFGTPYRGVLMYESEDYGLSGIRFVKDMMHTLKSINISPYEPVAGEPVMLLGYQQEIVSSRTMGFIMDNDEDDAQFLIADLSSDEYGNGGAIINTNNRLVGIQDHLEEDLVYAIGQSDLAIFYKLYLESLADFY